MHLPAPLAEKLYQGFIEEFRDVAIFAIDLDRQIISWSPGVESVLGYGEHDFVGRSASFIFTPEDRAEGADEQEFAQANAEGRAADMRWHLKKNGRRIFVEGVLRAHRDSGAVLLGYSKIVRDISPQGLGAHMLGAILDKTPDAIYLTDREGRFAYVNSQMQRLLGRERDQILGCAPEDFFPPEVSAQMRQNDEAVKRSAEPVTVEENMRTAHLGMRTMLSGKARWSDMDGVIRGVATIAQDISPRKIAEEEREKLVRELRRSNEDLAQFSYVVSHDLQAPLRVVKSYSQLLVETYQGRMDETTSQFVGVIIDEIDRMVQLIQSLLQYAQAGEATLTKKPIGIGAILDGVRWALKEPITESGALLTYDAMPVVNGDPMQLMQLFQNLVGNAIKYAREDVSAQIHVHAEPTDSGEYLFSVQDNGIGIERENFDRVFAPLKRLHGQEKPGAGIGLAICKKIVERHGGRIWVTSEPGRGSTFRFTLPSAQPAIPPR